jgi:propanediol utilization protein
VKKYKNIVFKKVKENVVLLSEGMVVAKRHVTDKKGHKQLVKLAKNVAYNIERANKKAIFEDKLVINIKNSDKAALWFSR